MNSFNKEFCDYLEYHLCDTFKNCERSDLKGFWCDGISPESTPESQLSITSIKENREIQTRAWIGKNGQDEYEMFIEFGEKSLNQYLQGEDLITSLPSEESMDWIDIDPDKKRIKIRLK